MKLRDAPDRVLQVGMTIRFNALRGDDDAQRARFTVAGHVFCERATYDETADAITFDGETWRVADIVPRDPPWVFKWAEGLPVGVKP